MRLPGLTSRVGKHSLRLVGFMVLVVIVVVPPLGDNSHCSRSILVDVGVVLLPDGLV